MPPISPSLPRPSRFSPQGTRPDASNARKAASIAGEDPGSILASTADEDMLPAEEVNRHVSTADQNADEPAQRLETMSMAQLWGFLRKNNRLDNGDIVVPANLVNIVTALAISMQETELIMNAMEDQLKISRESTSIIESLEKQMRTLINGNRAPVEPQPTVTGLPARPRTWAAVANASLKVTSNQTPNPPPTNRVINAFRPSQVIIRNQEGKKPFENLKANEIVQRVNKALTQLEVTIGGKNVEVKGAASLPFGSIKLFTATRAEATWLLENRASWSTLADPDLITTPAVFPVVVDSVPMEFYDDTEGIVEILTSQNPIPASKIHSIRWLSKQHDGQTSGSILINLLDKELTTGMIRGSVYFEGCSLRVRAYKKSRVQCFRCQEPGHISLQCKNVLLCKNCGASHDSRTCPSPKPVRPHCVQCVQHNAILNPETQINKNLEKYAHLASSANCPIRSKGLPKSPSQSC